MLIKYRCSCDYYEYFSKFVSAICQYVTYSCRPDGDSIKPIWHIYYIKELFRDRELLELIKRCTDLSKTCNLLRPLKIARLYQKMKNNSKISDVNYCIYWILY